MSRVAQCLAKHAVSPLQARRLKELADGFIAAGDAEQVGHQKAGETLLSELTAERDGILAQVEKAQKPAGRAEGSQAKRPAADDVPQVVALREALARNPEAVISAGVDDAGESIDRRASEVLAEIDAEHDQAMRDSEAFNAAINCYLGNGE